MIILDSTLTDLPLVGSPMPTFLIICAYAVIVKIIGPILMENRKPINLKTWIMNYNILQMIANSVLCYMVSILIDCSQGVQNRPICSSNDFLYYFKKEFLIIQF